MTYVVVFAKPGCLLTGRYVKGPRTPAYVKKWGYAFTKDKGEAWQFPSKKAASNKARIIEKHMSWEPGKLKVTPWHYGTPEISRDALLAMLEATAHDLWETALCATQTEAGRDFFLRMRSPVVGDIVMELTTYRRIETDRMGFGKLISKSDGDDCNTEWVIETPDGRQCKWSNAQIIAVPCGSFDWYSFARTTSSHDD